ncbi:FtsW/RodA/SpoVE family cell cycle protein [Limosilactobacillus equigenerosi]
MEEKTTTWQKAVRQTLRGMDWYLAAPYLILCIIGIVMVYSASADVAMQVGGTPQSYLRKQAIYVILGIAVAFGVAMVNLRKFRGRGTRHVLMWTVLTLLVYVALFGARVNGAQGWISLGFMSIQPAEICKLVFALFYADYFARQNDPSQLRNVSRDIPDWKRYLPWIYLVAALGLILKQPDTGGFLINAIIFVVITSVAVLPLGWSLLISVGFFLGSLLFAVPLSKFVLLWTHGYQAARFTGFLEPFKNASSSGAQLVNSYYAISNGGIFGSGIGNSIQKMGYLPEANTDFILAVIAEELGLLGVIVVLGTLGFLICRMVLVGTRCKHMYEAYLCYGIAAFFAAEMMFNVGAVCGLLPITGVTLPFISYGGSSMLVLSASLGIIIRISRNQTQAKQAAASLKQGGR